MAIETEIAQALRVGFDQAMEVLGVMDDDVADARMAFVRAVSTRLGAHSDPRCQVMAHELEDALWDTRLRR